jgi:hypothetical protein
MFLLNKSWKLRVIDIESSVEENIEYDLFKKISKTLEFNKANILLLLNRNKIKYKNIRLINYINYDILLYNEIYYIIKNWRHFYYILKCI